MRNPFSRSPHTSSRPMFTRVSWIRSLPESPRIRSENGKQYQIAVSDLPFPLPNLATSNPACRPQELFPVRVPVLVMGLASNQGQVPCPTRERSPHKCLVVSDLQPAPRPIPRSRLWFQIRHHQGRSRANGHHRCTHLLTAILARLVNHRRPCI